MAKNNVSIILFFTLVLTCLDATSQDNYELIQFDTKDGGSVEAALFMASGTKAVMFAHGAVFNKESWYFLAEKFQEQGITALSIDFRGYGNSKAGSTASKAYDILGAVSYLRQQGYDDINIVGGSMGGAAVLDALARLSEPVAKVVLMAPAGGVPITSDMTNKLFIVSRQEGLRDRVLTIYEASAQPKQLEEFDGRAHAQHMFKEAYAERLVKMILDFIGNE